MTVLVVILAALAWGALLYFIVVEPIRWYWRDRHAEPRDDFDERAASAALYPTTERTVIGQPATPFELERGRR